MMSAPAAATSSGNMALTVAPVPTGMKAGVRTIPRGIVIVPVRALPSRALPEKEIRSANRRSFHLSPGGEGVLSRAKQAGIAIGVKAVALFNGMGIGAIHQ